MANYSDLKATVQSVIKTNGNNEITGALLQSVLLSIINSMGAGYQFMGVATPSTTPGTPDQKVFYIGESGTYSNFGEIMSVSPGDFVVFYYDTAWHGIIVPISRIAVFNLNDPTDVVDGYPVQTTGQIQASSAYKTSRYLPVAPSLQFFTNTTNRIHCYDATYTHLGYVNRNGALLEGTAFVRIFWGTGTAMPYFVSEDGVSIRSRYREKDNVPFDMKNLLSTRGVFYILQRLQTTYFKTTKRAFVNLSTAVVGQEYTQVTGGGASFTWERLSVSPGDIFILTTYGTTASAKSYAILDANNIVLALYQQRLTDYILVMPPNAATLIVNTNVSGEHSLVKVLGGFDELITVTDAQSRIDAGVSYALPMNRINTLLNGQIGNVSSINAVRTPVLPLYGRNLIGIKIGRPNKPGYIYRISYALTSAQSDIGRTNGSAAWDGLITKIDWNLNPFNPVNIAPYTNAVGIAFDIMEVLATTPTSTSGISPLRITDFEDYKIEFTCEDAGAHGVGAYSGERISLNYFNISRLADIANLGWHQSGVFYGDYGAFFDERNNVVKVVNMASMTLLTSLELPNGGYDAPHCNMAVLGNVFNSANSIMPLIYVSQFVADSQKACFVYDLQNNNGTLSINLIKRINLTQISSAYIGTGLVDFVIDTERDKLIALAYKTDQSIDYGTALMLCEFDLPNGTGEILLSDSDITKHIELANIGVRQDAIFHGGKIYMLSGGTTSFPSKLTVLDAQSGNELSSLLFGQQLTNEPEAIGIFNKSIIITIGTNTLYRLNCE